jgi:hypothetical protein
VLTAIDCANNTTYSARLSNDGAVVLFQGEDTGLWTLRDGIIYRSGRGPQGLSADGETTLLVTQSGTPILHSVSGHDTVLPLWMTDYLSPDGATVIGRNSTGQPITWTAAGGIVTPDFGLDPTTGTVGVRALNWTASVLGGNLWTGTTDVPFVRNSSGTHLLSAETYGLVTGLNDDGTVAVGVIANGEPTNAPQPLLSFFRWTETEGITNVGSCRVVDWHGASDITVLVSTDGNVLAFSVAIEDGSSIGTAMRWTSAGSVDIDPGEYAVARGMSGDGNVIVGNLMDLDTGNLTTPFVWSSTLGKQNLADRLASAGADLHGWTFSDVLVSRDGSVLAGNGTCNGVPALFRAQLPR